ncbi:MAG: M16 family metallopeptidase [Kofleriaceae bacterium]
MRNRLLAIALTSLFACGSRGTPEPQRAAAPEAVAASAQVAKADPDALPLWPKVVRGKLPNGLTYYVMKHSKPEKRAFLWLAVNTGAVQEDDDQRGLAHFVEHMAFNGTKRFPEAAIVQFLEKIGMKFGAHLNAYTNFDETVYQLEVPTDDGTYLPKGLDILRDWAGDVSFDPKEVEKERGVVLEEWRLGRGAGQRLFDKQVKVLFAGSRYAERITIGLPETLKTAPRDTLVRYYKDWYRPDHMAVIAVGDFDDPAAIEKEIVAKFGDLKSGGDMRPRPAAGVPKASGTRVSIETDREMPGQVVSVYNILAHRPEATERDFRRIIVEQVYQQILNERLQSLSRRKEAPFAMALAGVQGMTREIDAFARSAQVKSGRVEDALRSLFVEVLRVEKHGVTESELERARVNLARMYDQSATEESTSDSREFTSEITRNFFEDEFMIGRVAERDLAHKYLPTVTLAELNALAKNYGGAENRVIVIAGPDGKPLPTRERVLAIIDEVARGEIDPWQDKAATTALMAQPPKPGKIVGESKIDAIDVTEWKLSNGVRVIVKPTDFENDSVSISGSSPGGLAMATSKQFNDARFADDVAGIGGVGELDGETLGKVLAGKQVSTSAQIGETTEGVDAAGSARDLETMFQLVHLRMTAPRKDDELIAVWKQNVEEHLGNQLRVPEVQFSLRSSEVLYKSNIRRKAPKPEDVAKVDPDKALAFYKDRFGDASDFTFVIVGAVELDKLRPLVETYLASLPANGRKERERDLHVRRIGGVVKKSWSFGQEPKARVLMTFHGDEAWSRDKDRDMFILGQVLSMRLREILREDLSGVYGVGASGFISRTPHQERQFTIQFGCAPDAVDKLIQASLDEVAAIAKNGVDAGYLEKIKQSFLRERETSLRTNSFWSSWLENAARYGDDPTLVLDPSQMIARMTPEHVKVAAKRYLDRKQFYQAILLPDGKDVKPAEPAAKSNAEPAQPPAAAPAQ